MAIDGTSVWGVAVVVSLPVWGVVVVVAFPVRGVAVVVVSLVESTPHPWSECLKKISST